MNSKIHKFNDNEVDIFYIKKKCARCGSKIKGDGERFECPNCGVLFFVNGVYLTHQERSKKNRGDCIKCGQSLLKGDYHAPCEDGNNSIGYIKCKYCGYKNIR